MSKKPLNISEEAAVQMPMKTVASLIIIVALGTMGYFQIIERLKSNVADTSRQIMEKILTENTEFRIKWPRGQLGSLPADSEQFMMIEDLYKTTDKLNKHIENMALNKVNIEFLRKQMDKVLEDIEKLKDEARDMHYKNGNGHNDRICGSIINVYKRRDQGTPYTRINGCMSSCPTCSRKRVQSLTCLTNVGRVKQKQRYT